MKRGTEKVGTQMCLPLEEWLEKERGGRSNAMRPIGEIAAGIVKKAGRSTVLEGSGGEQRTGPIRGGEEKETPRKETEGKRTGPEGPATFVDFPVAELPTGTKHTGAGYGVVVMCFVMIGEAEHHACSGDEDGTWIPF